MEKTNKHYTNEEDKVIIDCVKRNPQNLTESFKKDERLLETRSFNSISNRWYQKLSRNYDNRLENLVVLCPNCHSQTDNYRGRAKLSALSEMRDVEYRKFRETLTDNADGNPEPSFRNEEGAETRHDTSKE